MVEGARFVGGSGESSRLRGWAPRIPDDTEENGGKMDCTYLTLANSNSADAWFHHRCRANMLRRHRDQLHPGLAAELAELERLGY